jgi:SAM-dependent methyltransferase
MLFVWMKITINKEKIMPERIPHSDEAIEGIEYTEEYLQEHSRNVRSRYGAFLKAIRKAGRGGRYLEVGSGPGILTALVAEENPGVALTALELSPDMNSIARKYVAGRGLNGRITFCEGSVSDERHIKQLGKFDLIYSTFSLHHWVDPEQSIRILYSALDERGIMLIHDLKRVWWLYYLPAGNGFFESIRASYTPAELREMMKKLRIEKYEIGTPFPYFWQTIAIRR